MHSDQRSKILHQLQQACSYAARGGMDQVERHICKATELLDQASALPGATVSLRVARSYMEDAYAAFLQSDSLGVVLPLFAALQTIQQEPQNEAADGHEHERETNSARAAYQATGHMLV
jgi:hypothetical protein